MNLSPIHRAILDLAVEDSYDLVEVQARVQDILRERAGGDVSRIVRESVRHLFSEGLLSVWKAQELGGEEELLPKSEAEEALMDDGSWIRPEVGFSRVRVLATEAGERAYYANEA
jgi:hypothetical protein